MKVNEILVEASQKSLDAQRNKDPKHVKVGTTIELASGKSIDLSDSSLASALTILKKLQGKKHGTDWTFEREPGEIVASNFSGAERRFTGPKAIDKFIEAFDGVETVKGFKSLIRKSRNYD